MSDAPRAGPNIRRFLFFDEQRPTRAWMPTLEAVNERFAQYWRAALLQQLQPPVEVTPEFAIEVVKHGELIDRLAAPSHLTVVALKLLRGMILIAIEAELVGIIVESRFGGSGRLPVVAVPNREFAPIEQQVMRRVIERLLDQLALAWKPITEIAPEIVRHETKPTAAAIANSTDLVIISTFTVMIGNSSGKLTIAIPYLLLQPLHERLVATGANRVVTFDPRWSEQLKIGVGSAMTELQVEFAAIELTVGDFLNLHPGSVFEIARPDTVTVQSGGQPLFRGRWGRHGRKIAVRVEERLLSTAELPVATGTNAKGDDKNHAG
jgi:flagellar motor switch protein FliM